MGNSLPYGVYGRLSLDPDGTETSTQRQIDDGLALAEKKGIEVGKVYRDSDYSASKRDVIRPDYEAMLQDIRDGKIGGIIAWKLDRLSRDPGRFEQLLDLIDEKNIPCLIVMESLDLSTNEGKFVARILVAQANMEAKNTAVRVARARKQSAIEGKPSPGRYRPFGLNEDWTEVVPEEAALIKEAAKRILKGDALRLIVRDWEAKGVVTSSNVPFTTRTLKRMLLSPRVIGMSAYHGEIIGKGQWPALLDEETQAKVSTILERNGHSYRPPRYLLTGILLCSFCRQRMVGNARDVSHSDRYRCITKGCGKVGIGAKPIDEFVWAHLAEAYESGKLSALKNKDRTEAESKRIEELTIEIAQDEAAIAQLDEDYYVNKTIERNRYLSISAALTKQLSERKKELAKLQTTETINGLEEGESLKDAFYGKPLEWKRKLLLAAFESVVIGPQRRGYNRFDPSRVLEIDWKG